MDENMTALKLLEMIRKAISDATQLAITGIVGAVKMYQESKENQPGEVSLRQLRKAGKEEIVVDVNKEAIDIFKDKAKNLGVQFAVKALTSSNVAKYAVKKMFSKKLIIIPGLTMKLCYIFNRFIPIKLLIKITYNIQKKKEVSYER